MEPLRIYFDLESTGLDTLRERIVELAAICQKKEFRQLIDPGIRILNSDIHGIDDAAVRGQPAYTDDNGVEHKAIPPAPKFPEAFLKFIDWVNGLCESKDQPIQLIAHNCLGYDALLLYAECERHGLESHLRRFVFGCTLQAARQVLPRQPNYRLATLYKAYIGYELKDAHTALADTHGMAQLCAKLTDHFGEKWAQSLQGTLRASDFIAGAHTEKVKKRSLQRLAESKTDPKDKT